MLELAKFDLKLWSTTFSVPGSEGLRAEQAESLRKASENARWLLDKLEKGEPVSKDELKARIVPAKPKAEQPKPAEPRVKGYYRKDGTYVPAH